MLSAPLSRPGRGPSALLDQVGRTPWERLHVWDEVKKEQEVLVFEHALNTIARTKKPAEPDPALVDPQPGAVAPRRLVLPDRRRPRLPSTAEHTADRVLRPQPRD